MIYIVLVISNQRSIRIPLLTYLFENLLALRFFLEIPNVTKSLSGFIWTISNTFEMGEFLSKGSEIPYEIDVKQIILMSYNFLIP